MTWDEGVERGEVILKRHDLDKWELGDILLKLIPKGDQDATNKLRKYSEDLFLRGVDRSVPSLRDWRLVAERFKVTDRSVFLSWTSAYVLQGLDDAVQVAKDFPFKASDAREFTEIRKDYDEHATADDFREYKESGLTLADFFLSKQLPLVRELLGLDRMNQETQRLVGPGCFDSIRTYQRKIVDAWLLSQRTLLEAIESEYEKVSHV